MNSNVTNISPKFKAMTIINTSNNSLAKEEIKILTKMGQKIGTNSDTIHFNVMNYNNDSLSISHKAQFTEGGNTLECSNIKFGESNPFDYIKERMIDIKKLYNKTFSK